MSLKIYTNESVPIAVASGLRRRGVEAVSARDSGKLGLSDIEQVEYAAAEQMVIFTHDDDFLRIAHSLATSGDEHWGIVYVHQDRLSIGECIRRLREIADVLDSEQMRNHVEFL